MKKQLLAGLMLAFGVLLLFLGGCKKDGFTDAPNNDLLIEKVKLWISLQKEQDQSLVSEITKEVSWENIDMVESNKELSYIFLPLTEKFCRNA